MKCFLHSIGSHSLGSNVLCVAHTDAFTSKYYKITMDFCEWKLNMTLQMNYLQKDNWAHLLKYWRAINLSYKILHVQQ